MQAPEFPGCQIVEKLRSGPVADVYRAIQQPLGRLVQIKALSSSILPSSPFAATLEREARLLAELSHPGILGIYDFVRDEERMWLVLEFVDGWTLEELIQKLGKLPPAAAVAIALEVDAALEHAHQHGVVHRDVQPKNIVVSKQAEVKLQNFAVASDERLPTAPELLDSSASFSASAYLSPEQILGEPADPRSDLFSLGAVLYEMLSGKRPFAAPDDRSAMQRIRHDAPPSLGRSVPGVPSALERIVLRCLHKLASDRFVSAEELAQALESVQAELGCAAPRAAIGRALVDGRLIEEAPLIERSSTPAPIGAIQASLGPALRGLALFSTLIVVGGGAIGLSAWRNGSMTPARHASTRLELRPRRRGYLRVVADPWAYVFVDGQKVATTPFAEPIPLSAGTHYVRLEHPEAPSERRTVTLVPGETVLLDVKMDVKLPQRPDAGEAGPAPRDAGRDASP
jgi:eukaryotic-like serine/threonine-protein kinase